MFLQNRENDISSASMVAVGDGGWVHMWNVSGGGLVGEFNIWSSPRHQLDRGRRELECVTSLSVNPSNTTMYTGNSLGYMQVSTCTYILTGRCTELKFAPSCFS